MRTIDVVVKVTEPVRMAETTGVAAGYGHANISAVFAERLPAVVGTARRVGGRARNRASPTTTGRTTTATS